MTPVAVVTGAAQGIGFAVARELLEAGMAVALADLDAQKLETAVDELSGNGPLTGVVMDVTDPESIGRGVAQVEETLGAPTRFVNNAGIGGPEGLLADISVEDYKRTMAVNADSVFFCLREQLPRCVAAGGGSIVNLASVLACAGDAELAPYVASKHAVLGLTRSAALGYASFGVRVNSVHPGYIDTAINATLPAEVREALPGMHPLGRLGEAHEVAAVVEFLLSDRASFVTGSAYGVDGGYLAQ